MWGKVRRDVGGVTKYGGRCGKVCWGVETGEGRGMGGVGQVRGDGECEKVQGRYVRVYGVSVEKCVWVRGR